MQNKQPLAALTLSLLTGTASALPLFNEFSTNPPGTDPDTVSVELLGTPLAAFDGWVLSIDSDPGSPLGRIDRATRVTGSFDGNGLLLATVPDFENPSFTLILAETFTGTAGDDIDTDDDGVADDTSMFGTILDAIGVPDTAGDEAFVFGTQLGGTDFLFTGGEPELIFRDAVTSTLYAVNTIASDTEALDPAGTAQPLADFDFSPLPDTFGLVNPTLGGSLPAGDTDGDGDVDNSDLQTAIANFTGPQTDPATFTKTLADGDNNADGAVSNTDLQAAISNFTGPIAARGTVPEPASLALLGLSGLLALRRRRAG